MIKDVSNSEKMSINFKSKLTLLVTFFVFVIISFSQNICFELLEKYYYNCPDWNYSLNDFYPLGPSIPLGDLDKDGNNDILLGLPGDGTESGSGKIAAIDIVTPHNLTEKIDDVLKLSLTDVLIVSHEEDTIIPDFKLDAVELNNLASVKSVYNHLKCYPNPIKNLLNVKMHEKIEFIKVLDIHGRDLLITYPQSKNFTVNISRLSKGNYFLIAESSTNRYLAKITKK